MPVFKSKDGINGFTHRWKDRNGNIKRIKKENKDWGSREAKRQFEKFIADLSIDDDTGSDLTYNQLYKMYCDHKSKTLKARSISTKKVVNDTHISPTFGTKKISSINRTMIRQWQTKLLTMTKKDGSLYENKTLLHIQTQFKAVLNFAVEEGYLDKSPFTSSSVKRTSEKKKEMDFWTIDEFNKFISAIDDKMYKTLFQLLFFSGLRVGELQALTIKDYNGYSIVVNKGYDKVHRIVTSPKTANSYREVFLDDITRSMINDLIDPYKEYIGFNKDTLIFGFDKIVPAETIRGRKDTYCSKAKVKKIRLHDFRHSHVAMLIHSGFNSFEISARLGHSVTMVNEVYGHLYPNSQQKMVEKINKLNLAESKYEESDTNLTRSEFAS